MDKDNLIFSLIFTILYIVLLALFWYYELDNIDYFPLVVLILYLFIRMLSINANLWAIKCVCYFGVGVITLVDGSKAITLVAVIALIESFDLLFVNWLKDKLCTLYKQLPMFLLGYNFNDLQNAIIK